MNVAVRFLVGSRDFRAEQGFLVPSPLSDVQNPAVASGPSGQGASVK